MENISENQRNFSTIGEVIEFLRNQHLDTEESIKQVQKIIYDHKNSLSEVYKPKSIIESRLTSADEAFEKGMVSCGAVANISAEILRGLGLKVKLVHGESEESVDHAWLSVLNENNGAWEQYDLTRNNRDIPNTHKSKLIVDSFEDIREQIENDHETLSERQKAKGIK